MPENSAPKLPKGYTSVDPSTIRKAAMVAPVDSSDVIDRTQPQTLAQKSSEKLFDAKNYAGQLLSEAKKELQPTAVQAATKTVTDDAASMPQPKGPIVPPSYAMDEAMKRAGMTPGTLK